MNLPEPEVFSGTRVWSQQRVPHPHMVPPDDASSLWRLQSLCPRSCSAGEGRRGAGVCGTESAWDAGKSWT